MDTKLTKQPVPFTQVPNGLLYDPNISFKAKGIWAYMSAKPDGWQFSANRIANETKEERKAVLSGLKELSEAGYISAKKMSDGRIEYTLHWEVVRTSMSEPEAAQKTTPIVKPSSKKDNTVLVRPKRDDYDSIEEFEEAFYKWNKAVV